jgi:cytoskeletal protein CcmA (bactofilin family)
MVLRGSQATGSEVERRFTDRERSIDTVIGADVRIEAQLRGKTNVDISGVFDGDIDVSGLVWLRPGGKITGNLKATDVVIEGDVSGKILASNKIDLRASAHVEGELTSKTIAMAEGSFFEGSITKAVDGGNASIHKYEEKRAPAQVSERPEQPST